MGRNGGARGGNQLNVRRCLHTITYQIAGKEDPQQKRSLARLAQARANAKAAVPANGGGAPIDRAAQSEARLQELLSGPAADPSAEEVEHRQAEQKKAQAKIREEQMDHLMAHLDQYVAQGKMTEEEAGKLKKLHQVDAAVQSGKVDKEKGSKVRNSILSGTARYELDKKVKETVDYVVRYTRPRHPPATAVPPLKKMLDLTNKIVLVTGASSGIGWHLATELAGRGAQLVLLARRRHRLAELRQQIVEQCGRDSLVVVGDVAESKQRSRSPPSSAGTIPTRC